MTMRGRNRSSDVLNFYSNNTERSKNDEVDQYRKMPVFKVRLISSKKSRSVHALHAWHAPCTPGTPISVSPSESEGYIYNYGDNLRTGFVSQSHSNPTVLASFTFPQSPRCPIASIQNQPKTRKQSGYPQ
jgi:hypothetical protein